MDQDKQHEIYHKGFSAGQEHSKPSRETLEKFTEIEHRFEQRINDIDDKFESKIEAVKELFHKILDTKVTWSIFWSIVGLLTSIMAGMFYLTWNELQEARNDLQTYDMQNRVSHSVLGDSANEIDRDVSEMLGILTGAEIID